MTALMLFMCRLFILAISKIYPKINLVHMNKFLLFLSVFIQVTIAASAQSTDSLLAVYKNELQKQKIYDQQKERRITGIKTQLSQCAVSSYEKKYHLTDLLYHEYFSYQHDSAIVYAHRLMKVSSDMNDLPKLNESRVKLGFELLLSDMFKEASDCIKSIDPKLLGRDAKVSYYELNYTFYRSLLIYTSDAFYVKEDSDMEVKYLDSAIAEARPNSFEQLSAIIKLPDTARQRRTSEYLLYHTKLTPHQEAMIASYLSQFYSGKKAKDLLLISAIDDIRTSTKETLAAAVLGRIYNEEHDLKNAYMFLQNAQDDAKFFGSRIHEAEVATVLPYVAAENILIAEREKQHFETYLIIVVAAAIIVALVAFIIFFQLKNLKAKEAIIEEKNAQLMDVNSRLSEDAKIKEEYIGNFFDMVSGYIARVEKLKRDVERRIKTQKTEEVLKYLNGIDIKKERVNLLQTFDRVFIKLFPDFISFFNDILKPEDQVWPKHNEILTPNLRIFALMRLGVTDIAKIANILQYTESTVYTYKMRMKTKAMLNGDDFEAYIMKIKVVDRITPMHIGKVFTVE